LSEFFTILTNAGLAAVTNAALAGTSVDITHMAVGDDDRSPQQNFTALGNEVWRGALTRLARSTADAKVLECETRIPPEDGGFTVREVGLFTEAGIMIAVGNVPESYKPALESGSAKDMQIRMYIQHSNVDGVILKIDPAIVMASRSYVDDLHTQAMFAAQVAQFTANRNALKIDLLHPEGIL